MNPYLNGHSAPASSDFKQSIAGTDTSFLQDMVDLAMLSGFEVTRHGAYSEVTPDAILFFAPDGTRIHHFLAQDALQGSENFIVIYILVINTL